MLAMIDAPIVLIAYLVGSIASAIVVCRAMGLPDPRGEGSGNPGATNVLRIGGKVPAALTLAGDVLKGVLPVLLAKSLSLSPTIVALSVLAAFLGHLYPLYFRFQGGKGVATAVGAIATLAWPVASVMCTLWLAVAVVTATPRSRRLSPRLERRSPHCGSHPAPRTWPYSRSSRPFLLWRHRENIQRLISGTESRIGRRAAK